MNCTDEEFEALLAQMESGDRLIIGGVGDGPMYVGIRHKDGTEVFATSAMASLVRQIDASAREPVKRR